MTRCGSIAIALARASVAVMVAAGNASAQDCESMTGPARTDCLIGRARILGQQSGIAAGAARKRSDEANLRAVTGTPEPRRAKRVGPQPGK